MVAVLMSHLLGADASNTNVDAIYFPTANGADGADGADGGGGGGGGVGVVVGGGSGADDAVLSINASASPNPALSPGSSSTPVAAGPVNRVPGFGGSPSRAPARPSAEFSPVQHQQRSVAM